MFPTLIHRQWFAIAILFLVWGFLQAEDALPKVCLDGTYDISTLSEDLSRPNEFPDTPGPVKVFMDQSPILYSSPRAVLLRPVSSKAIRSICRPTGKRETGKLPKVSSYNYNYLQNDLN
jgi:hypothetical protein